MAETIDWLSLNLVPGLGVHGYWRLIERFGSPDVVLKSSRKDLLRVEGIREKQIAGLFSQADPYENGQQELRRVSVFGGEVVAYEDPFYPLLLKQLVDPPPVLYVLGRKELLLTSAVAMVGSRAATTYGQRVAFSFAGSLAAMGVTVVSGLALGIDAQSHAGALSCGGNTIAVLGCGLDVVYPRQNNTLYERVAKHGLLVSEYPLGTRPEGFRFPARNRIIAGLSKGVVVVEAARRSGSLITAQMALDYNREVFAVPGQVDSFKSEGAHYLLQQGAKLVQRVEDIVEELGFENVTALEVNNTTGQQEDSGLDPDVQSLLKHIDVYPQLRESLLEKSKMSPARVSELLLFLELDGLIEMLPGDMLRRV